MVFVSDFQVFTFYHVLSKAMPTPWTHMVLDVTSWYLIWLYWQYLPKDMCSSKNFWSLQAVDIMVAWYSSNILLDVLFFYFSCTYDEWYDFYLLVPYSLALNLELCILPHLLCGLLLDVVITWNGHIYDLASIRLCLVFNILLLFRFVSEQKSATAVVLIKQLFNQNISLWFF